MDKRRLSAIMFTDIVGYTRKMGDDEVKMLRLLKEHNAIIEAAADNHDGEIIKRIGDAFLVSFDSALNAVLCAIEVQQALLGYNKEKPQTDQVHIRIGIHLGDIVISEGDVFGDGVNVASRIEPLAHPGGVCITRSVYDIVKKKMTVKAVELGPQQLKNVDEAVEVFHLLSETVGIRELRKAKRLKKKPRKWFTIISGLIAFILAAAFFLTRQTTFESSRLEDVLKLVQNVEVSENRVAVLPLRNLTGSDDYQYISSGFSQDVIYQLATAKELYVYPMENILSLEENRRTFQDIRKILGANYLVTGSLNLHNDSLIFNVELLETAEGKRILSNRYTTSMPDRWQSQDLAAQDIHYQITVRTEGGAWSTLQSQRSLNPIANDFFQQGMNALKDSAIEVGESSQDVFSRNLELFTKAVELDSQFVMARLTLAGLKNLGSYRFEFSNNEKMRADALKDAEISVKIAPQMPEAHLMLATLYLWAKKYDKAEISAFKALQMRPNFHPALNLLGVAYIGMNKYSEAIAALNQALRICSDLGNQPEKIDILRSLANSYYYLHDYVSALKNTQQMVSGMKKYVTGSFSSQIELAKTISYKAWLYSEMRDYPNARDNTVEAIGYLERNLKDKVTPKTRHDDNYFLFYLWGSHYARLGRFEEFTGEYSSALEHYQSCSDIWADMNFTNYHNYINLRTVLINFHLGNLIPAEELLQKPWDDAKESSDSSLMSLVMLTKGLIFRAQGKSDSALAVLSSALKLTDLYGEKFRSNISELGITSYTERRCEIQIELGITAYLYEDFERAYDMLNIVVGDSDTNANQRARALFFSGCADVKRGNHNAGLKLMTAALDSTVIHPYRVEAHRVLGEILIDLNRREEAEKQLEAGRKMAEKSGMKGEIKRYDGLFTRLKEI